MMPICATSLMAMALALRHVEVVADGRIAAEHGDGGAHDVDGRGVLRRAGEEIDDALRQLALGAQRGGQGVEFALGRQAVVPEQVDDFLVADLAGEFIDVVAAVDELADVAAHVSDAGFSGDDSFETSGDNSHGIGIWI